MERGRGGHGHGHGHGRGHGEGRKSRSRSRSRSHSGERHGHGQGGHGNWGGRNPQVQPQFNQNGPQGAWGPDRDAKLRSVIDAVWAKHDRDGSGTIEPAEFMPAFTQICQGMGMPGPTSQQQLMQIGQQLDANGDGRMSKMEVFSGMKRMQGY